MLYPIVNLCSRDTHSGFIFIFGFLACLVSIYSKDVSATALDLLDSSSKVNESLIFAVHRHVDRRYTVVAYVGTPGQQQRLHVDISQPYVWIVSGRSYTDCNKINARCESRNIYYPGASVSYEMVAQNQEYQMELLEKANISAEADIDTLAVPSMGGTNLSMSKIAFFESEYSSAESGLLGLGLERQLGIGNNKLNFGVSMSLLQQLKDTNVINSLSYSLWLGNDTTTLNDTLVDKENVGHLLLGLVDQRYYVGDLYQYDMLPMQANDTLKVSKDYLIVPLTSAFIISSDGSSLSLMEKKHVEPVVLDSNQPDTFLPVDMMLKIAVEANALYIKDETRWYVDCDVANCNASLSFEFGNNNVIKVPFSYFISNSSRNNSSFYNGTKTCYLNLYPNLSTGFTVLGASFLRKVYLAVDLEGKTLAMAQARSLDDLTTSNVSLINSGSIPFASSANLGFSTPIILTISSVISNLSSVASMFATSTEIDQSTFTTRSFYSTSNKPFLSSKAETLSSTNWINAGFMSRGSTKFAVQDASIMSLGFTINFIITAFTLLIIYSIIA